MRGAAPEAEGDRNNRRDFFSPIGSWLLSFSTGKEHHNVIPNSKYSSRMKMFWDALKQKFKAVRPKIALTLFSPPPPLLSPKLISL